MKVSQLGESSFEGGSFSYVRAFASEYVSLSFISMPSTGIDWKVTKLRNIHIQMAFWSVPSTPMTTSSAGNEFGVYIEHAELDYNSHMHIEKGSDLYTCFK